MSSAAVAVGWSQCLTQLLGNLFGFQIPDALSQSPEGGGIVNLPAVVLVGLCPLLLIRGASESARVNAAMVLIKLGVLVMFIVTGITGATGIIFFAYIGLDAVSTAASSRWSPSRSSTCWWRSWPSPPGRRPTSSTRRRTLGDPGDGGRLDLAGHRDRRGGRSSRSSA